MAEEAEAVSVAPEANAHVRNHKKEQQYHVQDLIFPIYDQMMQIGNYPVWLAALITLIISIQMILASLWVYAPSFQRTTGKWTDFYRYFVIIFTFSDPLDTSNNHITTVYVILGCSLVVTIWLFLLIFYQHKYYTIPTFYIYIGIFLCDVVGPLLLLPSAYVAAHGIFYCHAQINSAAIAEIIIGLLCYIAASYHFYNGILMKSRSVVLTSLTFQLFDSTFVLTWFGTTTLDVIFSSILQYFPDWYFIPLIAIHLMIAIYCTYRLTFFPFYENWRNVVTFTIAIGVIILDIEALILNFSSKITFNYTIPIMIGICLIAYPIIYLIFKKRAERIKKELTYGEEERDVIEYFNNLPICKSPLHTQMYIVIGLSEICDYFIDGSMVEYIINNSDYENSLGILLQVVTLFPYEHEKLNQLFKILHHKRKLSFINRFLIYQIRKIRKRRLTTINSKSLKALNKVRMLNEGCKMTINGFWEKTTCTSHYIAEITTQLQNTDHYFKYVLENNPNNVEINREYVNFLIECRCDFDQAIEQYQRTESILDGKNYNVDFSFRSLINKFPKYLTDGIVDEFGRSNLDFDKLSGRESDLIDAIINAKSSSRSYTTEDDSHYVKDEEFDDIVARKIISNSRVRLALYRTIADSTPFHSKLVTFFALLCYVMNIAFIGIIYYYAKNKFLWRSTSYTDLLYIGKSVFYAFYSDIYALIEWSERTNMFGNETSLIGNISYDTDEYLLVNHSLDHLHLIYYCLDQGRTNLKQILSAVTDRYDKWNPYTMTGGLLKEQSKAVGAENSIPDAVIPASLTSQLVFTFFKENYLAGDLSLNKVGENLFDNDQHCAVEATLNYVINNTKDVFASLLDYNLNRSSTYNDSFKLWMIFGCIAVIVLDITPFLVLIIVFRRLLNKMIKVLLDLPSRTKEIAKDPIMEESNQSSSVQAIMKTFNSQTRTIMSMINLLFIALIAISIILLTRNSIELNNKLTLMIQWFYYSVGRMMYTSEIGKNSVMLILLGSNLSHPCVNVSDLEIETRSNLDRMMSINQALMNGNSEIPKSVGYDSQLDEIQIENSCSLGRNPLTMHDMYACSSLNSQLNFFEDMVMDVLNYPKVRTGNLTTEFGMNLIHIMEHHLYPNIMRVCNRVAELIASKFHSILLQSVIFLLIGAFASFFTLIFDLSFRWSFNINYRTFTRLLQRLPPQAIVSNEDIIDFLRKSKTHSSDENDWSLSKSIVFTTAECIIVTNSNGIIEIVNPAVQQNIGLTPDQMLGQHIANFAASSDKQTIINLIQQMSDVKPVTQETITLIDDDSRSIPFSTIICMMKGDNSNSLVFIMTNIYDETKKRNAAEAAKAKSEKLLYQILPKDIVVRLNRGEKDISFTIPMATIYFIDIIKFSQYAATLSPSEIMQNLSIVFTTFDKVTAGFPMVTKIKLIGDVYMAAAGIFNQDIPPTEPAKEAVKSCLKCLRSMEDINTRLNASLEVRIGVNSGGPLIGGILGVDKPTFDIIGDPINIASRLQSSDIPGRVQISASTKELIQGPEFSIEERGEVFLKGKGNTLTYFVALATKAEEQFALNMFSGSLI